ncbi:alpha-galactosidase [Lacipirellula sp.]|uniref:alpha-galactosidase n=1 Tax=Lacipirellula sp. TaxID=2691419 RepID=UPI003D0B94D5
MPTATPLTERPCANNARPRHTLLSNAWHLATAWLLIVAVGHAPQACAEIAPTPVELEMTSLWVRENLLSATRLPPFSFKYGTAHSSTFLRSWARTVQTTVGVASTEHVVTWTDPAQLLRIRCEIVEYHDHPAVEWTVYFKNIGAADTAICQDILGFDFQMARTNRFEYLLHGIYGDFMTADSYRPYALTMDPGFTKTFAPYAFSGKSSDGPDGWPYFNLQMPGGGMMMAIGWPGQWACSFTRNGTNGLSIKAGQQLTRMYLKPGEEIRTPLTALLFWRGEDVVRSQNLWRHWYVDYVLPHFDGQPQQAVQQIQCSGYHPSNLYAFLAKGIVPDICWRDAGWYPVSQGPYTGDLQWLNTGTWEINRTLYPRGFRAFSDYARSSGSSFLLWFEPERVGSPNSFLGQRPQWLLPATSTTVGDILNLGNPEALDWLINHIDDMINTEGLDWYREDMNGNGPLPAWRNADSSTRQGITENFYVQGHLAFWDELKARHPALRIDSCASGGRRNDLETMRRAVPLVRSDFQFPDMAGVVEGNQCHIYGLSRWLPFHGTGAYLYDPYSFRSFYGTCFGMGGLTEENTAAQQQAYAEQKQIGKYMLFGDYYPLTPYSLDNNVWIAWQFNAPSSRQGCVQVFRRQNATTTSITLQLNDLDPDQIYQVKNFDSPTLLSKSGAELMNPGLTVTLPAKGSAVFQYQPQPPAAIVAEEEPVPPSAIKRSAPSKRFVGPILRPSPTPPVAIAPTPPTTIKRRALPVRPEVEERIKGAKMLKRAPLADKQVK